MLNNNETKKWHSSILFQITNYSIIKEEKAYILDNIYEEITDAHYIFIALPNSPNFFLKFECQHVAGFNTRMCY